MRFDMDVRAKLAALRLAPRRINSIAWTTRWISSASSAGIVSTSSAYGSGRLALVIAGALSRNCATMVAAFLSVRRDVISRQLIRSVASEVARRSWQAALDRFPMLCVRIDVTLIIRAGRFDSTRRGTPPGLEPTSIGFALGSPQSRARSFSTSSNCLSA